MNRSFSNQLARSAKVAVPDPGFPFILAFVGGAISLTFGFAILSALGISMFVYYFVRLLQETGPDLPIESFILVVAAGQWIIGPVLAYEGFSNHFKMYMYVPEPEYMNLVVPAVLVYSIGLYSFRKRKRIYLLHYYADITRQIVNRVGYLPYYLIAIGATFSLVVDKLPPALSFFAFFLSNLKFVGLIYLIFSDRDKNKLPILILAFLITFMSSLRTSMFHDLLLWSAFIGMYIAFIVRPSLTKKIVMVTLLLLLAFVIQAVKLEYRLSLKSSGETEQLEKFLAAIDTRFENDERIKTDNIEQFVIRLNQGWIISRIMEKVPAEIPHQNGKTIVTAVKASLLPRLLYPDKPMAGGRENYMKYTGYYLEPGTSMGISLLGEAYINFGVRGAWVFMFIFGLLSSFIINKIFMLASKNPTIWLWFPLIMFHFIKAETELLVQLNYLVKSIILVYLFIWANKHFMRLRF